MSRNSDDLAFRLWPPVAVLPEERFLHERFGEAYDDFRRRVRRWL